MNRFILTLTLCLLFSGIGQAKQLGVVGRVYPIAERDALEEIEERARQVDWQSVLDRERPEDFRPANLAKLPRAHRGRSFLVDMTYILDFDIPDGKGGILYPKGYQFNPLDYVPFNQTLVVINGEDSEQVAWLKASPLVNRPDTLILLSGGGFSEVGQGLERAVFYATRQIVERFQLKAVPSVIHREGRMMEVEEIEIPEK
jgi:conjugal transfer pilus assembly protein TraW